MTEQFFDVRTTIDESRGVKNVPVYWFVDKRPMRPARPYRELIENYDQLTDDEPYGRSAAELAVDELFTAEEAATFVNWLKDHRGATDGDTIIHPAELPYPENIVGMGMTAVGGGLDFLMLGDDYDLPFKVVGLIDYETAYHRERL